MTHYTQYASTFMLLPKEKGGAGLTPVEYLVWQYLFIEYRLHRNTGEKVFVYKTTYQRLSDELGRAGPDAIKKTCQSLQKKGVLHQIKVKNNASWWVPVDPSDKSYYADTLKALKSVENKRSIAKQKAGIPVPVNQKAGRPLAPPQVVSQPTVAADQKAVPSLATQRTQEPTVPDSGTQELPRATVPPGGTQETVDTNGVVIVRKSRGGFEVQRGTLDDIPEIKEGFASPTQWIDVAMLFRTMPDKVPLMKQLVKLRVVSPPTLV